MCGFQGIPFSNPVSDRSAEMFPFAKVNWIYGQSDNTVIQFAQMVNVQPDEHQYESSYFNEDFYLNPITPVHIYSESGPFQTHGFYNS